MKNQDRVAGSRPTPRRCVVALAFCLTSCNQDPHTETGTQQPNEVPHTSSAAASSTGTDAPLLVPRGINSSSESSGQGSLAASEGPPSTVASVSSPTYPMDDGGVSGPPSDSSIALAGPMVGSCTTPIAVTCGESLHHDTNVNGQPNEMGGYNCSARAMSGPETIYLLQGAAGCEVEVHLADFAVDLFAILIRNCEFSGEECSTPSLGAPYVQHLSFTGSDTEPDLISIDGYDKAAGSYTLEVRCNCSRRSDAGVD